ncbi:MAG: GIY-YIG nuclease family protein [Candidatus Dojkabacteria bacterium]
MYFLYILKSNKKEWYYVGITSNVEARLVRHNKGLVRSTKSRIPYELVYTETYLNKTSARKRELEVKGNWQIKKGIIDKFKIEKNGAIV